MSERTPLAGLRLKVLVTWQLALLLTTLSLVPGMTRPVEGQEQPAAVANEPAAPPPRRPLRRLPTYFARVVTAQQREQIYELQARYQEQLDALLDQVRKLEEERDKEVFAVLTTEQQQQITAWTEEARQRRSAARAGVPATSERPEN